MLYEHGRLYSRLPAESLGRVLGVRTGALGPLVRLYLACFGFPDVASHLRFSLVMPLLAPKPGERILDAGCGKGIYANTLAGRHGCEVVGIDLHPGRLEEAEEVARLLGTGARFRSMSLAELGFPDRHFDKILCLEVLEHVEEDTTALRELARVLKPQGCMVLSTPLAERGGPGRGLSPSEPLGHVREGYSLPHLRGLLEGAGLSVVQTRLYRRGLGEFAIRQQQRLYKAGRVVANVGTAPWLTALAACDALPLLRRAGVARGAILKVEKRVDLPHGEG